MAYTRVQDGTTQALSATASTPINYTGLSSAGTAGNLAVLYVSAAQANPGSLTASGFTEAQSWANTTGTGTRKSTSYIFYRVVQSGDDLTSIAITTDTTQTLRVTAVTWDPGTGYQVPASPVDVSTGNDGGNTSATSASAGTTATTTQANGLGVAMVGFNAGTGATSESWSNSWSQNGQQGNAAFFADKADLGSTGTQETTLTLTGATARWWSAVIVAFKPPEAAGGTVTKTYDLQSQILQKFLKTSSADSLVLQKSTKTSTIDSLLKKTSSKTNSIDILTKQSLSKQVSIDSLILAHQTKSSEVDVSLASGITQHQIIYDLQSLLSQQKIKTHQADSLNLLTGTKFGYLDSLVEKSWVQTSIDSLVGNPTDRRVTQAVLEVIETPSTIERKVTQTILEVIETPSTNERRITQAVIEVMYKPGAYHNVDALLTALTTNQIQYDLEVVLARVGNIEYDLESLILKQTSVSTAIDALLQQGNSVESSIESLIKASKSVSSNVDSLIQKAKSIESSLDASLKAAIKIVSYLETFITSGTTVFYEIDVDISKQESISSSADALIQQSYSTSHDIEALLNKTSTISNLLDASITTASLKSQSVDALIQKTAIIAHQIDSLLQAKGVKQHSVDANIASGILTVEQIIDSLIQRRVTISHSIDIYKSAVRVYSFVDAYVVMPLTIAENVWVPAYFERIDWWS